MAATGLVMVVIGDVVWCSFVRLMYSGLGFVHQNGGPQAQAVPEREGEGDRRLVAILCGVVAATSVQVSGSRGGGADANRHVGCRWTGGGHISKHNEVHQRLAKHCREAEHAGFTVAACDIVRAGRNAVASQTSFACACGATDASSGEPKNLHHIPR